MAVMPLLYFMDLKTQTMQLIAPTSRFFLKTPKFALSIQRIQNPFHLPLSFLLPTIFNYPSLSIPSKTLLHCKATMAMEKEHHIHVRNHIDLTEKETLIFNRLKEVLRYFNYNTQLRVAGGWVRDKVFLSSLSNFNYFLWVFIVKRFSI